MTVEGISVIIGMLPIVVSIVVSVGIMPCAMPSIIRVGSIPSIMNRAPSVIIKWVVPVAVISPEIIMKRFVKISIVKTQRRPIVVPVKPIDSSRVGHSIFKRFSW